MVAVEVGRRRRATSGWGGLLSGVLDGLGGVPVDTVISDEALTESVVARCSGSRRA